MHRFHPAVFLLAATPPASAQSVFLYEDFASGVVPPSGWTELQTSPGPGWQEYLGADGAWHDDLPGLHDDRLVSPPIDLSTAHAAWLHYQQFVLHAAWRDRHGIEISLDGSGAFTTVHDSEAGDGWSWESVDLRDYVGVRGLRVSFHYRGDFATEWILDEVRVDESPTPPLPSVLHTTTRAATGRTYALLEAASWDAAQAAASEAGGRLVVVEDAAENDWVRQTFGTWNAPAGRDLWLGLSDALVEGSFVWSDGTPLAAYANWLPGEPNNAGSSGPVGEDYVLFDGRTGRWSDAEIDGSPWTGGAHGVVEFGSGPTLSVSPLVAGAAAQCTIGDATPHGLVALGYSQRGSGSSRAPAGPCGEITVDLRAPIRLLPLLTADARGVVHASVAVPSGTSGTPLWIQALDLASCRTTEVAAVVVG